MYVDTQLQTIKTISRAGIIPVLVLENVDSGVKLCGVLSDAGLKAAEITFRTKAAPDIIKAAAKEFPDLLVGAGTVLNPDDLKKAFDLGAKFAVAPGFNPVVVKAAADADLPFSPGVATPSEVEQAYQFGVRFMKFFPAEAMGGTAMLKSIAAPYRHLGIRFMPTGGVTAANAHEYLAIPEVAAVGGTWLGKASDLAAGNWDAIAADAKAAVELFRKARP